VTTGHRNRHPVGAFLCNCVEGEGSHVSPKLVNPTLLRMEEQPQYDIGHSIQHKLFHNSLPSSTDNSDGNRLHKYKNGAEIIRTVKRSNANNRGGIQLRYKNDTEIPTTVKRKHMKRKGVAATDTNKLLIEEERIALNRGRRKIHHASIVSNLTLEHIRYQYNHHKGSRGQKKNHLLLVLPPTCANSSFPTFIELGKYEKKIIPLLPSHNRLPPQVRHTIEKLQ